MAAFCSNHPEIAALNICDRCQKSYCEDCLAEYGDEFVCEPCRAEAGSPALKKKAPPARKKAWRIGKVLVMTHGFQLPNRCIKCGGEADGGTVKRKLSWHHPALYLLIIPGVAIYAIVAQVVQKTARVELPVCVRHRAKRREMVFFAWCLGILGLAIMVGGPGLAVYFGGFKVRETFWLCLVPGLLIVLFALFLRVSRMITLVTPKLIDSRFIHIAGVCQEYLASLPTGRHDLQRRRRR